MARSGDSYFVKRQTILAGAGIMMVASLLSRVLGLVRDKAIGHFWGRGLHTDAYWAAFNGPDLLYFLLAGGALSAAIVPVFTGYLQRKEEGESWKVANTLLTLLLGLAAVGVLVIEIFARQLVLLIAPGFAARPAQAAECAHFVRLLAPMVIFTVTSALSTGILQAHRHFTAPALAWPVFNFGVIGGAFVGGLMVNRHPADPAGLVMPAVGVVIGALLLVVVQIPALLARGYRFRLGADFSHPGVQEALRLFLPYMAGLAFTQICLLWLPGFFGSYFAEGGVTSLRYANRLVVLPLGLFGIAISTAVFPAMAERIAAGEIAEFRTLFSGTLRAVFFLSVPCAVGLLVLAGPIVRLLWRGGQFRENDVAASTFCLVLYALSLIGLSGLQITNRAFYSMKDRRVPPLVGIGYTVVIVLLAVGLMQTRLQYAAIAAATSVGTIVGLLVMFELLRRRLGGIDGRGITLSFLRISAASLALGVVAWWVSARTGSLLRVPATPFTLTAPSVAGGGAALAATASIGHVAIQVLLSMAAGLAAYLLVLFALRAPELSDVRAALRQRRARSAETVNAS